jgi:Na+/melibiose symporter-like transporter
MRAIWRVLTGQRDLRLLLSAGLVSLTGDWILRIGLVYRVYVLTGSTVAAALTMASSFLPQVLLGAVAGVFADRWDRRLTMIVADLLLAAGLLPLLLVHGTGQVWIVFAVLLWESVVQQFFAPAEQALLPRLVPDDQLVTANAVSGQTQNLSRLVGSGLGGVVAAAGGIAAVTLADAASFLISAALIGLVSAPGRADAPPADRQAADRPAADRQAADRRAADRPAADRPPVDPPPADRPAATSLRDKVSAIRAELADGLRWSARHRILRALMFFLLVTSLGEGIMSTLFAPFVQHVLHGSSQAYGVVAAVQAVGGIVGGLAAASIGQRASASWLLGWGAVAFGAVDLAIFLYPLGYVAVWPAAASSATLKAAVSSAAG